MLVLVGIGALQGAGSSQDASADPRSSFGASLQGVRRLMKQERWLEAREELFEMLEEHEGAEYAARRLGELRVLLHSCTFELWNPPPDPAEVVEGELLDYRPDRREVKVAYRVKGHDARADTFSRDLVPGDFLPERGLDGSEVWTHPFPWNGPYRITVRGRELPSFEPLFIVACATDSLGDVAGFGRDAGLYFVVRGQEESQTLDFVDVLESEGPYRLEIQVGTHDVKVFFDGRPLLAGAKARNVYGNLSFSTFEGIEEIVVEGKADLTWFQKRLDDELWRRRLDFDTSYDVDGELSAWWRELAPDTEARALESLFEGFDGEEEGFLGRSEVLFGQGDHGRGLEYAEALPDEGAAATVRAWLRGLFLEGLGRDEDALDAVRRAVELDPGRFVFERKLVELVRRTGTREAGLERTRELVERFADRPEAHEDLVAAVLLEADHVEARRLLQGAFRRGVRSKRLFQLEELLHRARTAPPWRSAYLYRSSYFEVKSDVSRSLCLDAANTLDSSYLLFSRRFGRIEGMGGTERYPVFIFSGEAAYLHHGLGLFGDLPVHADGLHSPILRQLLARNLPDEEQVLSTLRHQAIPMYLDALVGSSPPWLSEGLAQYFERVRTVRGQAQEGLAAPEHVALLGAGDFEWPDLGEFLEMGSGAFYEGGRRNEALAWLWVHYLERSSVPNKRLIQKTVRALRSGATPLEAVRWVFPAETLEEHERGWRAQLGRL